MLSAGIRFITSLNLKSSLAYFCSFMAMAANFVLPKSKDMPLSDEYFDEVFSNQLVYAFCCCGCQS